MRRVLYAKSVLCHEEADVKLELGCDGLELQLFTELINGSIGNYFTAEEVFDLEDFKYLPVTAVHAPLLSSYGLSDINIESLTRNEHLKLFDQVCKIANYFGDVQNKEILVIVHSEMKLQRMQELSLWGSIVGGIATMLMRYPRIKLCIENVTPIRDIGKGVLHLTDNFKTDTVDIVKNLRKELHTDRIYTVLDICHAKMTKYYLDTVYQLAHPYTPEDYSMEEFFRIHADYIGLIHLADMKQSGYGKGQHGTPFDESNREFLASILKLHATYCPDCPITLEVEETDYSVCSGYQSTKYEVRKFEQTE